jgi:hypothetical protein
MAFNGSGVYQLVMDWVSDAQAGIKIRADRHMTQDKDFAAALSNVICKDGQTTPTADIKLGGHRLINIGDPINPQDAVSLHYLTTSPFTVLGNNAVGRITFSGNQTDATAVSAAPLGIGFTQSGYFIGPRRPVTTTDAERVARFVITNTADPTDASLDLFSVDASGVHLGNATLAWNTYSAGTPLKWRAQTAGFGGFLTYNKTNGTLGFYAAPASVAKDADIAYVPGFTYAVKDQALFYANSLMVQAPAGNTAVACWNTQLGAYGMYVRAASQMGFGSLTGAGAISQEWMSLGTSGMNLFFGNLVVPGRVNAGNGCMNSDSTFGFYETGNTRIFAYSGSWYWYFNLTNGDMVWMRNGATSTYFRGSDGAIVHTAGASKPGGGPWLDNSDARVKDVSGPYEHGLAEIRQLEPVRYTFKGNDERHKADGKPYIGLVAQATEGPMPEMVSQESGTIDGAEVDDLRILDTSPLIFACVNAIKELAERLETLEAA